MSDIVPIHVVSDEEAEGVDFVICGSESLGSPFTDNVVTACCDCGKAIIHRPHAPKRPPKICVDCMMMRVDGGHA